MGKVIAVSNQKGGVGKTTTTINLAASLAIAERNTLVIDFDPQGNATSALGANRDVDPNRKTVYHALVGECSLDDIIMKTEIDCLSIAPADVNLTGAEIELVSAFAREQKLKQALGSIREKYDFIFVDCPPTLGLLTVNAMTAADSYLVPLQSEYFALEGLSELMQTVSLIKQSLNTNLSEEGIVLTMYDGRNKLAKEVESEVRTHFNEFVYQTVIPRNVKLSECASHGKPVLLYDIHSKGCLAYLNLAKEFLNRNRPKVVPPPFLIKKEKPEERIPAQISGEQP